MHNAVLLYNSFIEKYEITYTVIFYFYIKGQIIFFCYNVYQLVHFGEVWWANKRMLLVMSDFMLSISLTSVAPYCMYKTLSIANYDHNLKIIRYKIRLCKILFI